MDYPLDNWLHADYTSTCPFNSILTTIRDIEQAKAFFFIFLDDGKIMKGQEVA